MSEHHTETFSAAATYGGHNPSDDDHGHDHPKGLQAVVREIFAPHSHDAAASIDNALESSAAGIRAVKVSLLVLGITAIAQIAVVIISGSIALAADTIHNFSDALTAVPLWIAFALSTKAATRRYTYGFGRVEDLAGLFVVAMITMSAIIAGYETVVRLIHPQPVENVGWVALAGLMEFIGNEWVALYRIGVGRRIGSAALVADGPARPHRRLHFPGRPFCRRRCRPGLPAGRPDHRSGDHRGHSGCAAHRGARRVPPPAGRRGPGPHRQRRSRPGRPARGSISSQPADALDRPPLARRRRIRHRSNPEPG